MAEVDLVCGPANPLPESSQSFRLIHRLGSGGQADAYKAVRQSGGVASAPVTVKVFRPNSDRDIATQYRSWDKGDAVLMDLGGRGVAGICRRIDAFYGPPPHRPGSRPADHQVPYQVLEYLPGQDLKQLLSQQGRPNINAVAVLRTLAQVLDSMHRPGSTEVHPTLHMDIKPANVIILPTGEARVIDFTGARYSVASHITSIAYTPEAAGPEAREGQVGPSYDVHGFGAVAFFLVTGVQPRSEAPEAGENANPGLAQLRSQPMVEANPALRDHLLAPLADDPRQRPQTVELPGWIDRLSEIMQSVPNPGLGVDWGAAQPQATVKVPQQTAPTAPVDFATPVAPMSMVPAAPGPSAAATAPISPAASSAPVSPGQYGRGVAAPTHSTPTTGRQDYHPQPVNEPSEPRRPWTGPNGKLAALTGGMEFSVVGALFAFVCWGIWTLFNYNAGKLGWHVLMYVLVLVVAVGVFAMARLAGTILLVRLLGRERRTARISHLITGAFLVIVGISWLGTLSFVSDSTSWMGNMF